MIMQSIVFIIVSNVITTIPSLIVTAGCIFYLGRKKSIPGYILLAGNLAGMILRIPAVLLSILTLSRSIDVQKYMTYEIVVNLASFLMNLLFGIGFLLLMVSLAGEKTGKNQESGSNSAPTRKF